MLTVETHHSGLQTRSWKPKGRGHKPSLNFCLWLPFLLCCEVRKAGSGATTIGVPVDDDLDELHKLDC